MEYRKGPHKLDLLGQEWRERSLLQNPFPQALATVGHHTSRKKSFHHTPGHAQLIFALQAFATFESSPSLTLLFLQGGGEGVTREGGTSYIFLLLL